jgi:uracil-DNA glycosylase family 4
VTATLAAKDKLMAVYREYASDPKFDHLRSHGSNLVPGCGPLAARIMFIGEAPGRNEDEELTPFVGKAGQVLEEWLAHIKMGREQVFITNTVKYRPPDNRTPSPAEVAASKPYVARELALINPRLTVLLGKSSLEMIFPGYSIGAFHGDVLETPTRKYLVCYHPANWFYTPTKRAEMLADIEKVRDCA